MRSSVFALTLTAQIATAGADLHVLDCKTPAVLGVDSQSGTVTGRVTLAAEPDRALMSPDGRYLLVLNRVDASLGFGYKVKGPSSLTVVNLAEAKPSKPIELGWGIPDMQMDKKGFSIKARWGTKGLWMSPSGTHLFAAMPGHKEHPAQLAVVEIGSATLSAAFPLEREITAFFPGEGGRSAAFFASAKPKKGAPLPPELRLFDAGSKKTKVVLLEREPIAVVPSADGAQFYVLDDLPSARARLSAYSSTTLALDSALELPSRVNSVIVDTARERLLLLGSQEVQVVKGGRLVASLPVSGAPKLASQTADGRTLVIGSERSIQVFDTEGLRKTGEVAIKEPAVQVALSLDGSSAFALTQGSADDAGTFHVVDVQSMKLVTSSPLGVKGLLGALLDALHEQNQIPVGGPLARLPGHGPVMELRRGNEPSFFLTGDAKMAFILNTKKGELAAVETQFGKIVRTFETGGDAPRLFGGGALLVTPWNNGVGIVETATLRSKGISFGMKGVFEGLAASPLESRIAVLATDEVIIIDGKTGDQVAKLKDLRPCGAAFQPR
jgi:DNA-binding beta-propeller fold protein YncE